MRVLLTCVGKQDPVSDRTNEEGSVVTICRHIRPEIVYMFPSASTQGVENHTEDNARDTQHWLASELPDTATYIFPLMIDDPSDYVQVVPALTDAVGAVLAQLRNKHVQIHVNCSSGTTQMGAVLLLLAHSGTIGKCQVWQALDPSYATGSRVRAVGLAFIEEEHIVRRLQRFADQYLFREMAEEMHTLSGLSLYAPRRKLAAILHQIFLAYHSWDMMQYGEALKILRKAVSKIGDRTELKHMLSRQVGLLSELSSGDGSETECNLTDLRYNAFRCYVRGNFVDVVARFWRLYEGTLYFLLYRLGIDPRELNRSPDKDALKIIRSGIETTSSRLGMARAERTVEEFARESWLKFKNQKLSGETARVKAKRLRDSRNLSIAAHGMKPVSESDALDALAVMDTLMKVCVKPRQGFDEFPWQAAHLNALVIELQCSFDC